MTPSKPALIPILVGFGVNGWNVCRALSREGIRPLVLDNDPASIFWSCRSAELVYAESLSGEGLPELLNALVDSRREYVILSAIEEAVRTLSEYRDRLAPNLRLPYPPHATVAALLDKRRFYEQATARGFRLSPMYFLEDWDQFDGPEPGGFPCVIKTRRKVYLPGLAKAYRVAGPAEVHVILRELSTIPGLRPDDLVIQEWVPGGDREVVFCLHYYDGSGKAVASFVGRKIRQWPPETGGTASALATEDPEALGESLRFFESFGMRGLCSMEFKRSARDGRLHLIEPTVCRADYQEGVAVANGVNLPFIAYANLAGGRPGLTKPGRRPVKWIHLGSDYQAASHYMQRGELSRWDWLRSLCGPASFAVLDPRDPGPFRELLRRKIANRYGNARRALFTRASEVWNWKTHPSTR
jgi:D-aspartate ligase